MSTVEAFGCCGTPEVDEVAVETSLNSLCPEMGRVERSRLVASELSLLCAYPLTREG